VFPCCLFLSSLPCLWWIKIIIINLLLSAVPVKEFWKWSIYLMNAVMKFWNLILFVPPCIYGTCDGAWWVTLYIIIINRRNKLWRHVAMITRCLQCCRCRLSIPSIVHVIPSVIECTSHTWLIGLRFFLYLDDWYKFLFTIQRNAVSKMIWNK